MKIIILLLLLSSLCQAQTYKLNDSTYAVNEAGWVPTLIKDSVSVFRRTQSFYVLLEGKPGVEYVWTIKRERYVPPIVNQPILIQAENPVSIVNAAVVGTIVGNIVPGAVIKYASVDMGTRTKVNFKFSRGYTGSGFITFKVGSTSTILTFPSTGSWGTFQDIEFTIPSASGVIEINSSVIGPCNYDYFSFE